MIADFVYGALTFASGSLAAVLTFGATCEMLALRRYRKTGDFYGTTPPIGRGVATVTVLAALSGACFAALAFPLFW